MAKAVNTTLAVLDNTAKNKLPAAPQRRSKMSEGIESRSYSRIGLAGGRFRPIVNGVKGKAHPESTLEVIIVDWAPALQRVFYEGAYDPSVDSHERPVCFSDDNEKPHRNATDPQSDKCASCPNNVVGTGQNGKGRACGFVRRLLVKVIGDDKRLYTVDLKALSIFKGEQEDGYLSYQKYAQLLDDRGVDPMQLVTEMSFDEDSSVPVLRFRAISAVDAEELEIATQLAEDIGPEETARMLSMNIDGKAEAEPEEDPAPARRKPAPEPEEEEEAPAPRRRKPAPEPEEVEDAEIVEDVKDDDPKAVLRKKLIEMGIDPDSV